MPEYDHAHEHDNRNYDQADGKPLPSLLLLAFVVREIEFLIIKLVHLAAYYTKTDCKFFMQFRHRKSSHNSLVIYDILRACWKGKDDANAEG